MQNLSVPTNGTLVDLNVNETTLTEHLPLQNYVTSEFVFDILNSNGVTYLSLLDNYSLAVEDNNSSSNITTENVEVFPNIKQPVFMVVVLSLAYGIVFICTVLGNISVLCVVVRDSRFHSATYYLIANLALADFLIAVVVQPITLLTNLFNGWQFGAFMCKATPYLQGVAVCASVNTLIVIAVDRYIAICHVMRQRNTKRMAKIILFFIWIVALLLMIPWALYYKLFKYKSNVQVFDVCVEDFPEPVHKKGYFLGVIFLVCYAIPLIFIAACYFMIGYRVWNRDAPGITSSRGVIEKSKVRVIKMLVVVVVLFMFSWMPLYIIHLKVLFSNIEPSSEETDFINEVAIPFAQWLGTSNSCMNPLVYCLFSQKIRGRIRAMLCCSKPESRSMYSCRSMYNSALQPTASYRDSTFKGDAFSNGYSRHDQYQRCGSTNQRTSRTDSHRSSRLEGELIRLQRNNNLRSTHV